MNRNFTRHIARAVRLGSDSTTTTTTNTALSCAAKHSNVTTTSSSAGYMTKFTRESFDKIAEAASVTEADKADTREMLATEDEELYPSKRTCDAKEHYDDEAHSDNTGREADHYDDNWHMKTPDLDEEFLPEQDRPHTGSTHHTNPYGSHGGRALDEKVSRAVAGEDSTTQRAPLTRDIPPEEIYRRKMMENIKVQEFREGDVASADFGEEASYHYADKDHH